MPKPLLEVMLEAARMDLSPITSSAELLECGFHRSLASIQQEQGCSRLLFSWLWLVRSYPSWTVIGLILSIVYSHWIILFPEQSKLSWGSSEGLLGHFTYVYLFCSLLRHFPCTRNRHISSCLILDYWLLEKKSGFICTLSIIKECLDLCYEI